MAGSAGPDIVERDLTLCLDAGNKDSYPSTGNVWNDLSNFNRNFNLGVVTYNPGGWINNPRPGGTGTSSQFTLTLATTAITVGAWVRVYTHGDWNDFVSNNWVNSGWLLFGSSTWWVFGVAQNGAQFNTSFAHLSTNSWTHLVGTYDGTRVSLYVNGILRSTNTPFTSNFILDTNRTIRVGGSNEPGSYDISHVVVYNKALSPEEILQNYNAIKSRYLI